jgi:hypothetical protein
MWAGQEVKWSVRGVVPRRGRFVETLCSMLEVTRTRTRARARTYDALSSLPASVRGQTRARHLRVLPRSAHSGRSVLKLGVAAYRYAYSPRIRVYAEAACARKMNTRAVARKTSRIIRGAV